MVNKTAFSAHLYTRPRIWGKRIYYITSWNRHMKNMYSKDVFSMNKIDFMSKTKQ